METVKFNDRYGKPFAIHESTLATEACVWIGMPNTQPIVMAIHAEKVGVQTDEKVGWVDYLVPEDVLIPTMGHLTVDQAKLVVAALQEFIEENDEDV